MLEMKENDIISLRQFLPQVMLGARYFEHTGILKKIDIFKAVKLAPELVATQDDGYNCGVFCIAFLV